MQKEHLETLIRECLYEQIYRKTDLNGKTYCTLLLPEERNTGICSHCGMTEQYLIKIAGRKLNMYYCSCRREMPQQIELEMI